MPNTEHPSSTLMAKRFRGFLPVVVDIETGGFNAKTDALLEIAAVFVHFNDDGVLERGETAAYHVEPFKSANLDPKALEFTGIDPYHPFRFAKPENEVLTELFSHVKKEIKKQGCTRAVLVGHNASFDLGFLQAAIARCEITKSPFHQFTTFDTATLSAVALRQTVLARAVRAANIPFDIKEAHSAIYDAEKTAELFCHIVNGWDQTHLSTNSK
ncbi:MAG: ribonuclease T [Gammaproteobacteria bacterium]